MEPLHFEFDIATAEHLGINNTEILDILTQVYVNEGYTSPNEAAVLFEPNAVRARGLLIAARDLQQSRLAGMIILVPYESQTRRLAQDKTEAELHLLCVRPEYRRHGLGRQLIEKAIVNARHRGYSKLILWTQTSMGSAQRLYETAGFTYVNDIERNGRVFKVYEQVL